MCVVSMVSDHYMGKWPGPWKDNGGLIPQITPFNPLDLVPKVVPTQDEYANFKELLRKAAEYDRIMAQPECPAPEKLDWQKALEEFMTKRYGLSPKE